MATNYLDKTGLGTLWGKIKALVPTKVSDLNNDSGFQTQAQVNALITSNVKVGGRNLFRNTLVPDVSSAAKLPNIDNSYTTIFGTPSAVSHGIRITFVSTQNEIPAIMFSDQSLLDPRQTYTVSFDWSCKLCSADQTETVKEFMAALVYMTDDYNYESEFHSILAMSLNIKGTEQSGRTEWTFTTHLDYPLVMLIFGVENNGDEFAAGDYFELRNMKLEKGTVATDWTPAPEDIISSEANTTYAISMSGNVITLTGSDGNTSTVALPVYTGGVT